MMKLIFYALLILTGAALLLVHFFLELAGLFLAAALHILPAMEHRWGNRLLRLKQRIGDAQNSLTAALDILVKE